MPMKKPLLATATIAALFCSAAAEEEKWTPLFNGKDLTGWTPKFKGQELGVNYKDTFKVEDGVIKVDYSNYEKWEGQFGHLYTDKKFSNYRIRLEYRFTGDQVKDGPGWATQNSGIMLHCQDPKTLELDQDFPTSLEFQLLGAGNPVKTTGNLCTPGTYVTIDGKENKAHCINCEEPTRPLDEWVTAEAEVRGGKVIKHFINGKEVFTYTDMKLDAGDKFAKSVIEIQGNDSASEGWISLQAESHPCEFRKVEILELKP